MLLSLLEFNFCEHCIAYIHFSDVLSNCGVAYENKELTRNSNVSGLLKYGSLIFFLLIKKE